MTASDSDLLTLIRQGDSSAFEDLYDRYASRAFRVARSECAELEDAERAVQETFTGLWRDASDAQRRRGSFAAWLLTDVRRRAVRHTRREHAAGLASLLERLPDAQREVIVLAFYGGLTHEEIAGQLELPSGMIKGRMRLGLETLSSVARRVG